MKVTDLPACPCGVLDNVLEALQVVCGVQHGVELVVNLLLATGADLVVGALEVEASVGSRKQISSRRSPGSGRREQLGSSRP